MSPDRSTGLPWPKEVAPSDPFDGIDESGPFVFTPAIMSVGLVFSLITLLRDAFRWTGGRSRERRTVIEARILVDELVGDPDVDPSHVGLFKRQTYFVLSIVLGGAGLWLATAAITNFSRPGEPLYHVGWTLAAGLAGAALLWFLAAISLTVFRRWPSPPAWTQPTVRRALSVNPNRIGETGPLSVSMGALLAGLLCVILTISVTTESWLVTRFDEPVAEAIQELDWLDRLGPFDPFGSTLVTIGFVALIGLSGFRCRVMAVIYPTAFVVAWSTVEILQRQVQRARPSGYEGFESFPSGHMVQVVFIAGLLPPALGALFASRRLVLISRAVLVTAVIATGFHRVYLAKHWPLDALGGLFLGVTVVLVAQWVLAHRSWHQGCPSCQWSGHPGSIPWRRGVIAMTPRTSRRVGYVGSFLALFAAGALGLATLTVGLPTSPEDAGLGAAVAEPTQLVLASLTAVAAAVALRWKAVGAFLMAVSAIGLGLVAAIEYAPQTAFGLTVLLLIPAVVTWFGWQHHATLGSIAALAVLTTSALTATGLGVREVHSHYFGPTHPSSLAAKLDSDADWLWLGAVADDSATVTAGGFEADATVELQYWKSTDGGEAPRVLSRRGDNAGLARFVLTDLDPATTYSYRVVATDKGPPDPDRLAGMTVREFTTFAAGPQRLVVALGACARRGSNGTVFDSIVEQNPDLYIALGDLHYGNIASQDAYDHLREYAGSLSQPGQAALFGSVPTAYVWDDHDYGPNDADRSSPARRAVSEAYRSAVPHYGVDPDFGGSIAQAFTVGRVRFILSDTRSQRDDTTMLGDSQLEWFLDEIVAASRTHAVVVWANPTPWIGAATVGGDSWASYPDERRRIADAVAEAGISNLIMVSGDAHMVAIDDGTNSDYASNGGGGFPLLHAAALDRPGSTKGGPYSHGAFAGGGQYGILTIDDDGGNTVGVRLSGHRWDDTELVALEMDIAVPTTVD